ncbi:hypothetical protein AVI51_13850 [Piscirickettsia salmonis]|uniref:Uncharacterized protein n=1 Tax=Piscirickettsia salmonis TaxID=1238 RepID=A0A095BS45_PISSA|nr:hypothetical protein [Piscirickettsia salmonis]OAJ35644.1 hypothetical protein A0O36_00159 [Piscirickettsiaceae bacterium NZ-RLO1]RNC78490.1 hypothetical protein DA717_04460 [Piscirickettsiaceae bacterium NZ-RLO2]AKP74608.2 hypothetical protein PSLF89_3102 [Piscirickettsia salmonis LF-89 = ATCC VR-1361]ALA24108.1 hypothetical protein KW89_639 [Piscirickettsia salmonis]ALB23610.1 hypothetical protein KU39_2432 [Piscirickettsia salmonis]
MSIASLQSNSVSTNKQSNFNCAIQVKLEGNVITNADGGDPVHNAEFVPCKDYKLSIQHSFAAFGTTQATDNRSEQHSFDFSAKLSNDLIAGLMNAMHGQETVDITLVTYRRVKGNLEVSATYTIDKALILNLNIVSEQESDSYVHFVVAAPTYQFDGGQKSGEYTTKIASS